jgi:hypothetical protein
MEGVEGRKEKRRRRIRSRSYQEIAIREEYDHEVIKR